jgi:hypothetical protein
MATLPLAVPVNATDTTITVIGTIQDASGPGTITIGSETISYVNNSGDQFLSCTRGVSATVAVAHQRNEAVTYTQSPVVTIPIAQVDVEAIITGPWSTLDVRPISVGNSIVELSDVKPPVSSNMILQSAGAYAALAQSTITNTGSTVLTGNLGLYPGTSVTGFPPGTVSGTKHVTDAEAAQAQIDATAAALFLQAMGPGTDISSSDLGSSNRVPGVYSASSAGTWTAGPLTLNGAGTYVFLFGTSLTIPASASIVLTNGATADRVYFVTGTAITFGAANTLYGNFLAGSAITTAAGTVLHGRLLTYGVSGTAITFPSAAVITNPLTGSGIPTGKDIAPTGSRYTDILLGNLYINTGTQTYPVWTLLQEVA